jgi:hypothetical protein
MTRIEPDPSQPKQPDKSLGDLFGELSGELGELVKTQVELAKTEVRAEAEKAKRVGGAFGAAAFAGYMAALLLSFAVAWGLSEIVPEGVAFLIVGAVYAIAAWILFNRARERAKELNLVPPDTMQSIKEDVQWARQKLS